MKSQQVSSELWVDDPFVFSSAAEETDLGTIFVVATRRKQIDIPYDMPEIVVPAHEDPGHQGGGGGYQDPTPMPLVSHDGSPAAKAAAEAFVERADILDGSFDLLDPNANYTLSDGRVMSGNEIQSLWRGMSFHFNSGQFSGTSAAGENVNGAVKMDGQQYLNYIGRYGAELGGNYFALHEIGHVSDLNNNADVRFYAEHVRVFGEGATYDNSSGYFINNERYANNQAASFSDFLDVNIPFDPPHGYTYDHAFM